MKQNAVKVITLSQEIINYLEQADSALDVKQIARATRIDPDKVSKSLYSLHKNGHVSRTKNSKGRYEYSINKKTANAEQKTTPKKVVPAIKKQDQLATDKKDSIENAFNKLEQSIKTQQIKITDIELKISTLQRLSELLDDSIASVLDDIKTDIINISKN